MIQISNVFDELKKLFSSNGIFTLFTFFSVFDFGLVSSYQKRLIDLRLTDFDQLVPIGGFFTLFIISGIFYIILKLFRSFVHGFFGKILLNFFYTDKNKLYADEKKFLQFCIKNDNQIAYEEYKRFKELQNDNIEYFINSAIIGIIMIILFFMNSNSSLGYFLIDKVRGSRAVFILLGIFYILYSYYLLSRTPIGMFTLDQEFVEDLCNAKEKKTSVKDHIHET